MAGSPALTTTSPAWAAAVAQSDPRPLSEHRRALSLAEMQTAFDFEPVFFGNVLLPVYDFTAHGDGSEFTLRRNRQAYDWVDIVPTRPAIAESQVDLSSELMGAKMKFPIIVAPSSTMKPLHPDGEIGMYKAATAASNTLMMLSINTSTSVTLVAPASPGGQLWGQFYPVESLDGTQRLIDTYANFGVNVTILTVDEQASYYERTQSDRNYGGQVRNPNPGAAGPSAHRRGALPHQQWPAHMDVMALCRGGAENRQRQIADQGHPGAGRCQAGDRAWRGRDHRVQSWRPLDGLWSVVAGGVAGDRGGCEWPRSHPVRQRHPPRRRHLQGAGAGGERGSCWDGWRAGVLRPMAPPGRSA